jgi:PncC family amidohydrolase
LIGYKIFDIINKSLFKEAEQYTVKLFGEISDAEEKLSEIEQKCGAAIFYYKEGLISTIKIICKGDYAVSEVFSAFHNNIYAEEDVSLDKRLLELLRIRKLKLSVAESLTGGMICSKLIGNSGASESFYEGLVTYSNKSKIDRLNIDENIIKDYGAVSYEAAYEMAAGLIAQGCSDVSIASTGIAGPEGGTLTKPVGLVYIAVGTAEKVHVFRHIFQGSRNEIREASANAAMFYAIKVIKDKSMDYEVRIS